MSPFDFPDDVWPIGPDVPPGPCKCGQPKGRWTFADGDGPPRLMRCADCEARADAACRELEVVLAEHLGPRRRVADVAAAEIEVRAIDSRPCDLHVDATPRTHYTEDDLS